MYSEVIEMEYFDRIQEALKDKLNGKELTLETSFKDLKVDSLDLVDLVFELEEEIGIQFEDEELLSIKTVNDLLKLIDLKK
jgi:acyl carrier protein